MTIFEIIKCIFLAVLTVLLGLMALITHRIGTIRKWEIEKEQEARKQPEFYDEYS